MDTVRIGLVGAGFMGKIHTLAYRNASMLYGSEFPPIETVVVADPEPDLAERAVSDWGWSNATRTWQEVTAGDVDVVDICTPNDTHVDIALDALAHGKHVLCEKPLAVDADGALRLCEAAVDTDLVTQVGFLYRQWPAVGMARRLVEEGAIGEIRAARARFLLDYNSDPEIPMSWRFDRKRAGSGALGDIGSHCIDLLQHLVGPISAVTARMRTYVPRRRDRNGQMMDVSVDDQCEILADFETGASGTILASWAATGHKCDLAFELIGESGAVEVHLGALERAPVPRRPRPVRPPGIPHDPHRPGPSRSRRHPYGRGPGSGLHRRLRRRGPQHAGGDPDRRGRIRAVLPRRSTGRGGDGRRYPGCRLGVDRRSRPPGDLTVSPRRPAPPVSGTRCW